MQKGNNDNKQSLISLSCALINLFIAIILVASLLFLVPLFFGIQNIDNVQKFMATFCDIMISSLKIAAVLLILVVLWRLIFWEEKGITFLPFEVIRDGVVIKDKAISCMLIGEIQRISKIYEKKDDTTTSFELKFFEDDGGNKAWYKDKNINATLFNLPPITLSSVSIPFGPIIVIIRDLLKRGGDEQVITGYLQKNGSIISLIASLKHREIYTWEVSAQVGETDIPNLVRNLSFKMLHHIADEDKVPTKTWLGFKYVTEARDEYYQYTLTKNKTKLKTARYNCLKAANSENECEYIFKLIYTVSIEYFNCEMYDGLPLLLNTAANMKPKELSIYVLLGMTYNKLELKVKANEAYEKAIKIDPKSAEDWYNKGFVFEEFEMYSDAIECYDKAHEMAIQLRGTEDDIFIDAIDDFIDNIKKNREDSCNKNYIKICFEKGVMFAKNNKNEDAIKYYKRAIELYQQKEIADNRTDNRIILIHIALARLYRKMGQYAESAEQCKLFRQLTENSDEYTRAYYEAVCGSADEALKLLEIALTEDQVPTDWARQDPDFE